MSSQIISHFNGTSYQIALCLHQQRLSTLSLALVIVCKPPNCGCTLLNTSGVAHVITHDLVNITIFCYDYKLCLSTIITFEQYICTIIVQIGQYVSVFIFGFTAVAILDILALKLTFDALNEL